MNLDPHVAGVLQHIASLGAPPLSSLPIEQARLAEAGLAALAGPPAPIADVHDISIPVRDGAQLTARVYRPDLAERNAPIIITFHGGGFVLGSLDTHDTIARTVAHETNAVVVSVAYRLAPEHRFPTAPHDCYDATGWIAAHAETFGGDPTRIALCGDSAGGNLAIVVAQTIRDSGGPDIAGLALLYPAVDLSAQGGSLDTYGSGYLLETVDIAFFLDCYLNGHDPADPLASPARHPNQTGLPTTFIATCEYDPLRDQGEALARRLAESGNTVEHIRYNGATHAIAGMTGAVPLARQILADAADRLRQMLQ